MPEEIKMLLLSYLPPWWDKITYEELYAQEGDWTETSEAHHLLDFAEEQNWFQLKTDEPQFMAHIAAKFHFDIDEPFRLMMSNDENSQRDYFHHRWLEKFPCPPCEPIYQSGGLFDEEFELDNPSERRERQFEAYDEFKFEMMMREEESWPEPLKRCHPLYA